MHLVIVDGHAIAHRAYHSIPSLTVNGQPVNALYGFYSMLLSAIDNLHPNYLIVCLDSPGPTFRQSEFIGYRAKRKIPDRDLIVQLPLLPETLKQAHISNFSMGGYEADDLIATITKKSLQKIFKSSRKKLISKITIITGDKDLMQLVTSQVDLFVPIRGLSETKIFGPGEVKEKLGVLPLQVIDLKALMGDMSDNYPGVEGIGPKTAVELLEKYDSLDGVYSHLSDLNGSVRLRLEKGKDNAYLSQKLATLIDNIPLTFTLRSARWNSVLAQNLLPVFDQYHFKSLSSRLQKKLNLSKKETSINNSVQTSLF
ncbi:MAG: 5'-3' exonuclease H3TH domain-containing protein [Candidatus Shapirobacteria bacterium]